MRHGRQFLNAHAFRHRRDNFVDQLAALRPDARTAENLACPRMGEQLHEAVEGFQDERLSVIVERVARNEEWNLPSGGVLLRQTDGRNLWFRKNDAG